MKKSTLLLAMIMASTAVNAQVINSGKTVNADELGFIPKEFSADGKAKFIITCEDDGYVNERIDIYDDELNKLKSLNPTAPTVCGYKLIKEKPEIIRCFNRYDAMEWEVPSLTLDDAKQYIANQGYSVDSMSVVKDSTYFFTFDNPSGFYYRDWKYGRKYPTRFWALTTNGLYQVFKDYTTEYGDNWVERKEYDAYGNGRYSFIKLGIGNCENSLSSDEYVLATQTLFNNDEAYEYICPVLETRQQGEVRKDDRDGDGEIDRYETYYSIYATGFKVISESGAILSTVSFGNNLVTGSTYQNLITINDKRYLRFDVHELSNGISGASYNIFYKIDRNASSIRQMGAPIKTKVYPTVADRNETITVEVGGNAADREVFVHNAAGQTVFRQTVPAGQNTVQVNAAMLSRGLNVVSVKSGKGGSEACKVIVK